MQTFMRRRPKSASKQTSSERMARPLNAVANTEPPLECPILHRQPLR